MLFAGEAAFIFLALPDGAADPPPKKIAFAAGNCHLDRSEAEWRDLLLFQ
jgi:hypothetical protein